MTVVVATVGLSILFCGIYLGLARRWRIVDTPNERSSHRLPTPHGGGTALLLAFASGLTLAALQGTNWSWDYLWVSLVALLLMGLGIVDDLLGLSVRLRLPLYALACLLVAWILLAPVQGLGAVIGLAAVALAMLWLVNLYNFMDGIDGIAAGQCLLACGAAALLSWRNGAADYALFCLLLGASQLGFLVWNWPPARLFMGDAGSIPTGFLLAGLAVVGVVDDRLGLPAWLVLLAIFIVDASWTLLWRVVTGQPFTRPHRLHAYQRLSSHWSSHLRVDLLCGGIFCGWLLPLAWLAEVHPNYGFLLVILAYLPLLLVMAKTRPVA